MENRVLRVYIITNDRNSENFKATVDLFSGNHPSDLTVDIYSIIVDDKESPEINRDYLYTLKAFTDSEDKDKSEGLSRASYVLLVKDNMISNASSTTILNQINQIIRRNEANTFDILYLNKYLDACNLYRNGYDLEGRGITLYDTIAPNGYSAVMYTPRGIIKFKKLQTVPKDTKLDYVIAQKLTQRNDTKLNDLLGPDVKFLAVTTNPNMLDYNIDLAKGDQDYFRTQMCAPVAGMIKPDNSSSNMNFFFFIIILLVILIFIWALITFGFGNSSTLPASTKVVLSTT